MATTLSERWTALTARLDGAGDGLAPPGLRRVLAGALRVALDRLLLA